MTRKDVWSILAGAQLLLGSLCGCAELDISHDAPVDFSRYRSVTVDVQGSYDGSSQYLASELDDISGFQTVLVAPAASDDDDDEPPATDAYLTVDMQLGYFYDSDGFLIFVADATYELADAEGKRLASDRVSESSGFADAAADEALDEVARAFIPPYDY